MKTALVFLIGLLLGANLVYFFMARGSDCKAAAAAVEATDATGPTTTPAPPVPKPHGPSPSTGDAQPRATPSGEPAGLLVPVQGIAPAQLSDTFNDARGSERSHNAMDIMAPTGTPVVAVADGKLVKLFDSKAGGLTMYQFDTTETYSFYYAHLDRYADGIAEGQMLRRGQVIGYVGATGNADPSSPHLHFAVYRLGPEKRWHEGTPINPYPLLRG